MSETPLLFGGSIPETYDRCLGPVLFAPSAAELVKRVPVQPGMSVLELACGTGILSRAMLRILDDRSRLIATDISEPMMAVARRNIGQDPRVEIRKVDAMTLPFQEQSIDAIICQFGAMLFPDPAVAFGEVRRVLRPGGSFTCSTWSTPEPGDLPLLIQPVLDRRFPDRSVIFMAGAHKLGHPEDLERPLNAAGFDQIRVESIVLESVAGTAQSLTEGLLEGSPLGVELNKKDPTAIPELRQEFEMVIAEQFGSSLLRLPMRVLIASARRPKTNGS